VDNDSCLRRVEDSGSATRDLANGDETAERTTHKSDNIIQSSLYVSFITCILRQI
jgi:hypothetical protein